MATAVKERSLVQWIARACVLVTLAAWMLHIVGCMVPSAKVAPEGDHAQGAGASGVANNAANFGDSGLRSASQPATTLPAGKVNLAQADTNGADQKGVGQVVTNVSNAISQSMSLIMAVLLIMLDRSKQLTTSALTSSHERTMAKCMDVHEAIVGGLTEKLYQSVPATRGSQS